MSTAVAPGADDGDRAPARRRRPAGRAAAGSLLHVFLIVIVAAAGCSRSRYAVLSTLPHLRLHAEHGYFSFGGFTFDNYINAWEQADFAQHFLNTL